MLRQSSGAVRVRKDDCDCGILGEVFDGLEAIIKDGEDKADGEADSLVAFGGTCVQEEELAYYVLLRLLIEIVNFDLLLFNTYIHDPPRFLYAKAWHNLSQILSK